MIHRSVGFRFKHRESVVASARIQKVVSLAMIFNLVMASFWLAHPTPVRADYVSTAINRIFLDPASYTVVADGYDLNDEISFIFETTPVITSGAVVGAGAWATAYLPAGAVVVGADFVSANGDGTYSEIPAEDVAGISNGCGKRGCAIAETAGVYENGVLAQNQQDTGIFYSTDARTQLLATALSISPTGPNVTPQNVWNQWDYDQITAFGIDAALSGNAGRGVTPVINIGGTWYGTGSPVSGPNTYFTHDYNPACGAGFQADLGCVGPWNRIQYANSKLAAGFAVAPGLPMTGTYPANVTNDTVITTDGHILSPANPLPSTANAVRFVHGYRRVGDLEVSRITLKITDATVFMNALTGGNTFCLDSTGGDNVKSDRGPQDNVWRYYEGNAHVCFHGNVDATLLKQAKFVNGVAGNGGVLSPNDIIGYEITVTNTSAGTISNLVITDTVGDLTSPYDLTLVAAGSAGCAYSSYNGNLSGTPTFGSINGAKTVATWNTLASLAAGQSVTVYMCAKVNATTSGRLIRNTASATYSGLVTPLTSTAQGTVTSKISGTVYDDQDGSAGYTPGDMGLAGITIKLYAADGVTLLATTVTSSTGYYEFNGWPAATYIIKEVNLGGYDSTGDVQGSLTDDQISVTLASGTGAVTARDFFDQQNGGAVTPVTVSYFQAQRRGGRVHFAWSTATETGNVGFNLYVEQGRKLARLNDELLPSQSVDSLNRLDYSFSANADGNVFYIEDVSVIGETRRHGPFALGEAYGGQVEADQVDWSAIRVDDQSGRTLRPNLAPAAAHPASLTLKVSQSGLYRLTYEMLRDAGLDLAGVLPAKIQLTNRGKVVPIYVNAKGRFGPGAYFEFYGQALDTIYTDTNVYNLQVSQAASARIPAVKAAPGRAKPAGSYAETLVVNNQRGYANYSPSADAWYDTSMLTFKTSQSWEFPFQVDGLVNSTSAALELEVWGVTNWPQTPDHHLIVSLNGVTVADQTFDGLTEQKLSIALPAGALQSGANTLRLTLPGDTGVDWDLVNLDKFSITYQRVFQAADGRLDFIAAGQVFQVTNLPGRDVVVYRINDNRMARLNGVKIQASGTTFTATFAGTTQPSRYLVTSAETMYIPTLEAPRPLANLNRPAQYLVIAHPDFIPELGALVQARQAQGLSVSVVDVNDLYAQYTYGVFDPRAIQQYIAYAAQNLGTEYVLLVGGDTYDYRNYLGVNSVSFIPSLYVSTGPTVKSIPSDPLYADVNNDQIPELAIGRFPVRTSAELDLLVNKTLAYAGKDYGGTAVFASDKNDGSVNFKHISNAMAAGLPSGWTTETIHLDDMAVAVARAQLLDAMNRGTALVTFTGHSGPTVWTFSNLFKTTDAAALTNHGRPFVAVQWGCWNTYYVDPSNNYLVQKFLFSGDQGAAAALGATTLVDSASESLLGQLLTPRLAAPGMSLGLALRDAKLELAQAHPELLDVLLGWSLMGDPALMIQP